MSVRQISSSQRRAHEKMFSDLNKITDSQRDEMSPEMYRSFCEEYEKLHYILWPSSTLCVPNKMSPEKRQQRDRENEDRRKKIGFAM
ncbi:hypothetical protein QLL95_gp0436 [Cotonvirus japonicus]|uniref:Uncharacterized protein n=1 Tax=Cotonvirus japonicus TaxID=2811091 RepID=A0ABM7NUE6_9VIRU|nr:hypothetical protein QLL95_gp0436 [Cotonvirus japonicus]BCS83687.1 hypothetical protein [Cotonvirus japonicus]